MKTLRSTFSALCVVALFLAATQTQDTHAHLGEEHPPGGHDYFPDFPVSSLADDVYIADTVTISSALDFVEIPDGTHRFLGMRSFNRLHATKPDIPEIRYAQLSDADTTETEGSVSVALHPGFAIEGDAGYGKFYAVTIEKEPTVDPDFETRWSSPPVMHSIISEWTANDVSEIRFEGSSRELMRFEQGNRFHNVNDLAFGPDELLYIAIGEDNFGSQAADTSSVYGKILRIDPAGSDGANGAYGIPNDNPFVSDPQAAPEVFAYGMRNPWRISFDRETGALFAADVGFDSIEEIDLITKGGNYGWPAKEGSFLAVGREVIPDEPHPISGLTLAQANGLEDPLFELDQTDTSSIIGGVLYRGQRFPELVGRFVFGSWSTGDLYVGDPATGDVELLLRTGEAMQASGGQRYVSINEDVDGELYLVGGTVVRTLFRYPDANESGDYDVEDAIAVCDAFGSEQPLYDLNGDFRVDTDDMEVFFGFAGTLNGDMNMDGEVGFGDFLILSQHFEADSADWSMGDLDCNDEVGFADFLILSKNFGHSPNIKPVPEPVTNLFFLMLCFKIAITYAAGRRP